MKTQIKLELETTIELPQLPNFIKATSYPANNEVQEHMIPVENINDAQLKEIGEAWTRALVLHAEDLRMRKSR